MCVNAPDRLGKVCDTDMRLGLILTSLVQLTMFPLIRAQLANFPDSAKKMINVILAPLAVCDVSHQPSSPLHMTEKSR